MLQHASIKRRTDSACSPVLVAARKVLNTEGSALVTLARRLDESFVHAVELIADCRGRIALTGVGKPAAIAQKIAGTMNSTGTRAYFLDATAALHGDLGMLHPDDVSVVFSHSGASQEIVRLLPSLRGRSAGIVAITGNANNPLAMRADAAIVYGPVEEACPLSLAPSTSTTVMLALGDALAFCAAAQRGFSAEEFASFHPAGALGLRLARVDHYMRSGEDLRLAPASATVRNVLSRVSRRGRRTGAIMLLESGGILAGLFTDSDLARLFEQRGEVQLDRPISEVMTRDPWTVAAGSRLQDALDVIRKNKISELPVLDDFSRPVGLLDITDLIAFLPADEAWGETPTPVRRSA